MRKAFSWRAFLIEGRNFSENRNGWLGREGSNLRMAESKSAALPLGYAPTGRNEGRIDPLDRLRQRRSIEGVAPFQQPDGRISVQNQASWRYPLCWVISLDAPRGAFGPLRAAQYRHLRVESTLVSWEDGSS